MAIAPLLCSVFYNSGGIAACQGKEPPTVSVLTLAAAGKARCTGLALRCLGNGYRDHAVLWHIRTAGSGGTHLLLVGEVEPAVVADLVADVSVGDDAEDGVEVGLLLLAPPRLLLLLLRLQPHAHVVLDVALAHLTHDLHQAGIVGDES